MLDELSLFWEPARRIGVVFRLLAAVGLAALLTTSPATAQDPKSDLALESVLELAGANRPQLEAALAWAAAQGGLAAEGMDFLLTSSPTVDLGVVTAEMLIANVELALQARREFAYGQQYNTAVWLNYVLPLRVSQEPLSAWRSYFYAQLKDQVKDCRTLGEAATIVGQYYGTLATYKPTQRRDQSPLATMKGGYGRCEELVILFIDCCRSVGIPARMAYCPYWAHSDDNHAWWEVLGRDGRWHMDAPYDEFEAREQSWVTHAARQAPIVIAVAARWLPAEEAASTIDRPWFGGRPLNVSTTPGACYVTLNETMDYRQTGTLAIRAPEGTPELDPATGKPFRLNVSIFNYGALRLVARPEFRGGNAQIWLGVGDYILSTNFAAGPRTALVHVSPHGVSGGDWASLPAAPDDFVLFFPKDPPAPVAPPG